MLAQISLEILKNVPRSGSFMLTLLDQFMLVGSRMNWHKLSLLFRISEILSLQRLASSSNILNLVSLYAEQKVRIRETVSFLFSSQRRQ